MKGHIDFEELLKGYYKRGRRYDPMAGYYASLGATVRSNEFGDRNLNITDDMSVVSIFFSIILSARFQRDFKSIQINDFSLPFTMKEINTIEKICLCEITINSGIIIIDLIDKIVFEKEIGPYLSHTKLHEDYLSPEQREELIEKKVPKLPSTKEIIQTLKDYDFNPDKILEEVQTATKYEFEP